MRLVKKVMSNILNARWMVDHLSIENLFSENETF